MSSRYETDHTYYKPISTAVDLLRGRAVRSSRSLNRHLNHVLDPELTNRTYTQQQRRLNDRRSCPLEATGVGQAPGLVCDGTPRSQIVCPHLDGNRLLLFRHCVRCYCTTRYPSQRVPRSALNQRLILVRPIPDLPAATFSVQHNLTPDIGGKPRSKQRSRRSSAAAAAAAAARRVWQRQKVS